LRLKFMVKFYICDLVLSPRSKFIFMMCLSVRFEDMFKSNN